MTALIQTVALFLFHEIYQIIIVLSTTYYISSTFLSNLVSSCKSCIKVTLGTKKLSKLLTKFNISKIFKFTIIRFLR